MTSQSAHPSAGIVETMRYLYGWLSPRRRAQMFACVALMVLGAMAELVTIGAALPFLAIITTPDKISRFPWLLHFFDLIGAKTPYGLFFLSSLLLCAAVLGALLIRLALTWVSQKFILRLGHDMAVQIYDRLLHQAFEYHAARNSSEILAGMEKVQTVTFSVLMPGMTGIISAFIAMLIVGLLVTIDPFTAIVAALSLGSLYIVVSLGTRRNLQRNGKIIARSHTRRTQQLQEGLGGIRDILIQHSQPLFLNEFRKVDNQYRNAQTINFFIGSSPRVVMESVGILLIVFLALYMDFQPGGLTTALPILGTLALGAQRLLPLLQLSYVGWSQVAGNFHSLEDVVELMSMPIMSESNEDRAICMPGPLFGSIILENVDFRYAEGGPVLRDINLHIRRGERVGFIGKTGSGKSTLLDIVMGLLEPQKGRLIIDGVPLLAGTHVDWQLQIAHVPQTIFLTDASIADNIAFGDDPTAIDMNRVRSAAARAQLLEFIDAMPEGFASEIGERGVRLSGGQRQRLGIARALYKEKAILIMDEATSALDDDTEKAVMEAIGQLGGDVTVLMIAHRLSTLSDCDRIVRMQEGRIIQTGTFRDVITAADRSAFTQHEVRSND